MMTVGDLRALIDGLDDATPLRLATQPRYPTEQEVSNLKLVRPNQSEVEDLERLLHETALTPEERVEVQEALEQAQAVPEVLYLTEGSWVGYASADLWVS